MTEKGSTTQVYRIVIKASAQAIWDAITKPEWTERYAYGGRVEYELKAGGRYRHWASADMKAAGLPAEAIQLVPTTDRAAVGEMLRGLSGNLDVIVPRGGRSLVERVQNEARVPVFAHLEGLCHIYVDRSADLDMAKRIVVNAKMRRTGICGAAETLLIDSAAIGTHLMPLIEALTRVKDSFNSYPLDRLATAGAIAAIEDEAHFDDTRRRVMASRERLATVLRAMGFEVLPSEANFLFARHPAHAGAQLAAALRERAILVRRFTQPARIADFLRISIGTDAECNALLQALSEILQHAAV